MNVEILAPAGGEQSAVAALTSGANAVYLGIKQFSAREGAENFDMGSLFRTLHLAHLLGAKVYVALNTLIKDSELEPFFETARTVWNAGADAILVQDLFLGRELKKRWPEMVLHLSTQAGCCNIYGAEVAKKYGFSRVVLARETPIEDIRKIAQIIETEVFVQGALCTAFSGQCYFSSFAGNNSGNRGRCKQPCRKQYKIDRTGYEKTAYALSTSDLSVGARVRELIGAGVCSLKIEGRMRRPEYVGAAVKYYRALLDGTPSGEALTALTRAYNRGDYTEGLAFGQKKDFLSRNVQGHIGERIGTVFLAHGASVCHTNYVAEKGDGFKILRGGLEVGGAAFGEKTSEGFTLATNAKLKAGDEVRLTTSVRSNSFALMPAKAKIIQIRLQFLTGETPKATCGDYTFTGDVALEASRTSPLKEEELIACFQKTDSLPLQVEVMVETDGVFLPKSALNAFRRSFYEGLVEHLCPTRTPLPEVHKKTPILQPVVGKMTAEIGEKRTNFDIFIYKPLSYETLARPKENCVYLYLPPFFTSEDEALVADVLPQFDGVFCEGYYGIALAEKYGLKLFAGAGFNITNKYAALGVQEISEYFTLSKEISEREQQALMIEGAFVLAGGAIKAMDLCYCPFERTCRDCDKKKTYRLTDEAGRVFSLRRYRFAGMGCRFEVYNCADLEESTPACSRLFDRSVKASLTTKGHRERSML